MFLGESITSYNFIMFSWFNCFKTDISFFIEFLFSKFNKLIFGYILIAYFCFVILFIADLTEAKEPFPNSFPRI